MKSMLMIGLGLVFCSVVLSRASAVEATNQPNAATGRIGVYDSRAVAVAYAGSKPHEAMLQSLIAERDKAKAEGNQRRVAELEAQGRRQQELAHRQGFSTAPVDNILEQVKDKVELVRSNAQVSVLISKWDEAALAKHKTATQVDVTGQLVDVFNPNERQRKSALEIQKHKPIPMEELEKQLKTEGQH